MRDLPDNVAVSARAGVAAGPQRVSPWFWHEAAMGKAIQSVRNRLLTSEDPLLKAEAYLMVAWAQAIEPIELPKFAESYQSLRQILSSG